MKTTTDTKLVLGMPSEFWRLGTPRIFMCYPLCTDGDALYDLGGNLRRDLAAKAAKLAAQAEGSAS